MNKTLAEKLASARAAEAAFQTAIADLVNASTGEALAPGESVVDLPGETSYANAAGAVVRSRIRLAVREASTT